MRAFVNTDTRTRCWLQLTDAATGRTLELAPGERCELDVPNDFADEFLHPEETPSPAAFAPLAVEESNPEGDEEHTD